jgi:hypothetical protein
MMETIRYVGDSDDIQVEMLDLIPLEGRFDAENCVKAVLEAIDNAGLLYRNWIGDFSDKCHTMRGVHEGVVKKLQEIKGLDSRAYS